MEGGTEHDLRILEQEEEEERTDKAEGPKKEEPRPPEPGAGKGPTERPEGDDGAKVVDFGVPWGILGFPLGILGSLWSLGSFSGGPLRDFGGYLGGFLVSAGVPLVLGFF